MFNKVQLNYMKSKLKESISNASSAKTPSQQQYYIGVRDSLVDTLMMFGYENDVNAVITEGALSGNPKTATSTQK